MPADSTIARLKFDTTVSNSGLRSGMAEARQIVQTGVGRIGAELSKFGGFGGIAGKMGFSMPSFGGLGGLSGLAGPGAIMGAGVGAAAAIYGSMQESAQFARGLQLSAEASGLNVEQYQELARASRKSGLSIEETVGGLHHLEYAVFQAGKGNKGLTDTFKRLGLSSDRLKAMNAGEQLEAVAKGLSNISNVTERHGVERELFGREGVSMDPMLQRLGGSGGLSAFKSWHDLSASETRVLGEQKSALENDWPAMKRKFWSTVGMDVNTYSAEIGGWLHGRLGEGLRYREDLRREDMASPTASAATLPDTALHGFGAMVELGSQAAYEAQMAQKYGVIEQQQIDLLTQIRDRIPPPTLGAGDAMPF